MCFGIVLEETKLSKPSSPLISFRFLINFFNKGNIIRGSYTMGTPRRIDVDISSIRRRPNFDDFHVISAYFFDVISMAEKSTLFPRTFSDVISMVEVCTLFLLTFFDVILMGKNLTSFLVSCKLMKTFEKVFPEFVTLNSWLLQDCSL